MSMTRMLVLTSFAMVAFAGNSLLCRLALKDAQIDAASFTSIRIISGALVGAYVLAAFLPGLAVFVRRLHDANRSAWWILIGLIPLVGSIVLLVFLVTEGTRGENDHGPDPRLATDS